MCLDFHIVGGSQQLTLLPRQTSILFPLSFSDISLKSFLFAPFDSLVITLYLFTQNLSTKLAFSYIASYLDKLTQVYPVLFHLISLSPFMVMLRQSSNELMKHIFSNNLAFFPWYYFRVDFQGASLTFSAKFALSLL